MEGERLNKSHQALVDLICKIIGKISLHVLNTDLMVTGVLPGGWECCCHPGGRAGGSDTQVCQYDNSRMRQCKTFKLIPWVHLLNIEFKSQRL